MHVEHAEMIYRKQYDPTIFCRSFLHFTVFQSPVKLFLCPHNTVMEAQTVTSSSAANLRNDLTGKALADLFFIVFLERHGSVNVGRQGSRMDPGTLILYPTS